jgi:hypothetical protein
MLVITTADFTPLILCPDSDFGQTAFQVICQYIGILIGLGVARLR